MSRKRVRIRGSVPLASDVAAALARVGQREHWVGPDDLVFASPVGPYMSDAALRLRFKAALKRAGLRDLRFHDLRHTFGTRMIAKADIRRVQEWMGHAHIQTTMKYLHHAPHAEDARLINAAFALSEPGDAVGRLGTFRGRRVTLRRDAMNPGHLRATLGNSGQRDAGAVSLPRNGVRAQRRLVSQWAQLHQSELSENWQRRLDQKRTNRIDPLA